MWCVVEMDSNGFPSTVYGPFNDKEALSLTKRLLAEHYSVFPIKMEGTG